MREFGAAFGTAYQVYDDCVDLFGSEAGAGKSLGTDLAKGKLTWPVLLAWESASPADRARLEKMIQHWQPANLSAVNELLVKYESFEPTLKVIAGIWNVRARHCARCPKPAAGPGFLNLVDFLAQQTDTLAV